MSVLKSLKKTGIPLKTFDNALHRVRNKMKNL